MASRLKITRLSSQFTLFSPRPLSRLHPPHISSRNATRPSSSLPRVTNSSVWTSMIPKFIRNRDPKKTKAPKSKEWNPATFFIFIFLLIGSQAIRMLGLRNEFANFNRSADAKLDLLREVIGRMQKGEKVDVEKLLGAAGDEGREREWEEVLQEIEKEDSLWRKSQGDESQSTEPSEQKPSSESLPEEPQEALKPDDKPPSPPEGQKPRPFAFY